MAGDMKFEESLLQNLNLQEPWLPPKPWESVPTESGAHFSVSSNHKSPYDLSSVSEASLVRLVLNALHGVESAVDSIEKLSALFYADPADRSGHRIPTLWSRSLSTHALGEILKSIGFSGSLVVVLYKFVDYFTCSSFVANLKEAGRAKLGAVGGQTNEDESMDHPPHSLVNQAFAVAVRTVLEGYLCALDTLKASVHLRRSYSYAKSESNSSQQGSPTNISHSEATLLEVYLHTKELRTQIEGLAHICHLYDTALSFPQVSFEHLIAKAVTAIRNFHRGGNLLTYLYRQLQEGCLNSVKLLALAASSPSSTDSTLFQNLCCVLYLDNLTPPSSLLSYPLVFLCEVVDPAHCTLLKFLFLRSLEPYCTFIRSWIYEAKISDPYGEFIVEYAADQAPHPHGNAGIPVDFPLATIREQDGAVVPCFLRNISVPLLRAGQQLQVVMKLLRLCNSIHSGGDSLEEILPTSSDFPNHRVSGSSLSFNKEEIEAFILSRKEFYCKMHEKLENFMDNLDIKYRQAVLHDAAYFSTGYNKGHIDVQYSSTLDETLALASAAGERDSTHDMDSEASSMGEDFSYALDPLDSSEDSSTDGSDEQADAAQSLKLHDGLICSKENFLSSLSFSSLSSSSAAHEFTQVKQISTVQNDFVGSPGERVPSKNGDSCRESVELSKSWISGFEYAGDPPPLGWPVGSLDRNPLSIEQRSRDNKCLISGIDQYTSISSVQRSEEEFSRSSNQVIPERLLTHESCEGREYSSSNSYLIQSWNAKYSSNVLSMNPMLTKNAFLSDVKKYSGNTSKISAIFPCFDFSSVTDPLKVFDGRFSVGQRHLVENKVFRGTDSGTSALAEVDSCRRTEGASDVTEQVVGTLDNCDTSLNVKNHPVNGCSKLACGGSSWQELLRSSRRTDNATTWESRHDTEDKFEIPLDFIVDKCLLQEILIQYRYVSRFCIKLLEGGFALQEHFQALRRYHFMEIADWADLFVPSLWHHKWYFTKVDQKIPEIQGLLESSIQRSSCERDRNKDRLFVYVKDQNRSSYSTAAVGLHSFDFIGLGYRVDWPVSIVLTQSALNIYAEIFTFLVQLKLAVLSLAGVWCSLKDLKHLVSQSSEKHQLAKTNLNYLVKLRHQVNHFVSTLQQYVLSQLSDVSWCRFCDSLKHQVKDMMDLGSVHMAYLTDSLRICFLSDDTRSISNNLESILQCTLDFRACLVEGVGDIGADNQGLIDRVAQFDISQAVSIKKKFDKNIEELHSSYLKSSKHEEFGLSHFWCCLNYNEYYSNAFGNDMLHYNLFIQ